MWHVKKFDSMAQILVYYEWDDIQKYICQELRLKLEGFRDVDNKFGKRGNLNAAYKDWWHVWITLNREDISNDSYETMWFDNLDFDSAVEEYGDWVLELRPILEKIQKQINGDHLVIHYSW